MRLSTAALLLGFAVLGCHGTSNDKARRAPGTLGISLGEDREVKLDGVSLGPLPRDSQMSMAALAGAIRARPRVAAEPWKAEVEVPPASSYVDLVRLLFTAGQAYVSRFELRLLGEPFTSGGAPGLFAEPLVAALSTDRCTRAEVDPVLTFAMARGAAGRWMTGQASFVDRRVPTRASGCADSVAASGNLWAPGAAEGASVDCGFVFKDDAAARAACAEGQKAGAAPKSVSLGGASGCLLPASNDPKGVSTWAGALTTVVDSLGLRGHEATLVAGRDESNEYVVSVAQALEGRVPLVFALPKDVNEHSDTPRCDASVRTLEGLRLAAARWLGAQKR